MQEIYSIVSRHYLTLWSLGSLLLTLWCTFEIHLRVAGVDAELFTHPNHDFTWSRMTSGLSFPADILLIFWKKVGYPCFALFSSTVSFYSAEKGASPGAFELQIQRMAECSRVMVRMRLSRHVFPLFWFWFWFSSAELSKIKTNLCDLTADWRLYFHHPEHVFYLVVGLS